MVQLEPSSVLAGPKRTARWGSVVTVNLGGLDRTLAVSRENRLPRASVVITLAAQEFRRLSGAGEKVQHIIVLGSERDPTEHPDFKEIVENLRALRNKWYSHAKLVLLSTDPHLERTSVRLALGAFDKPIVRLEYGTVKTFRALTGRPTTELAEIVRHLASLDRVIVQARFVRGEVDNSTDSEVRGWIRRLREVQPQEILVTTPASKRGRQLRGIPSRRLDEIVEEVGEKVGAPVHVVPQEELVA